MMTVKQVSVLTGVSVRTLQFYDGLGLLKPTKTTEAGYRLYGEDALETLQQILFFKELNFTLREIKTMLEDPRFDRAAAFQKQRELIQMKRDRLTALLGLLDKLIKGESCMEFEAFDMSGYFKMLSDFKKTHTDEIVKRLGSVERFDELVSELKAGGEELAAGAVKQYGGVEEYTAAMERSLRGYLEEGPTISPEEAGVLMERTEELTRRLTADLGRDPAGPGAREAVGELVAFAEACGKGVDMGKHYWAVMAENYLSNPVYIEVNDRKYGPGASEFIGRALSAYLNKKS